MATRPEPGGGRRKPPSRPPSGGDPMQPSRPKPKGQGQKHAEQRKSDKASRDKASYRGGLTVAAVKADSSLNASEKERIIKIIKRNKSRVEG